MGVRGQESQKKVTSFMDGPFKNRPRQLIILQHNILDLEKNLFALKYTLIDLFNYYENVSVQTLEAFRVREVFKYRVVGILFIYHLIAICLLLT